MGLFPAKMLEATIITPKDDFAKLIVKLAETEKLMIKENIAFENLEVFYPASKLEKLRSFETIYKDLIELIPEPKEKLGQKIGRAYKKQPLISPLFEDWEDLTKIEEELELQINKLRKEIQDLISQLDKMKEEEELNELIAKGFRLLDEEHPYETVANERTLVGVLTTTKESDAEEFLAEIQKSEVVPLLYNKFMIFAQDKEGQIARLVKNLSAVRWYEHKHKGPEHLNKTEIENEILKDHKQLETQIKELEDEINQFAIKNKEMITAIKLSIESYGHLLRIYVSSRKTEKTLIVQGWVAQRDLSDLESEIKGFSETILITKEPLEETKNVPFVIARNPIKKSFQSIVGLYGLPSSKEVDPTIFFIFTFSLFFGIMFGDMGHGLILVVIGLLGVLARGLKKNIRQMFLLVMMVGITSFLMGFIFGEAFGTHVTDLFGITGEGHHDPVYVFGLEYPFIEPVKDLVQVFNLTLIIGSIHVTLGLILKLVNQVKHREFDEILEGTTSQFFLYAAILYFLSSLGILDFGIDPTNEGFLLVGLVSVSIGVGLALLGQGLVSVLFKKRRQNILRNFLSGFGMGLIHLLESFSTFISNTISYGRMLAMLVAHVVFLSVINALAEQVSFIGFQILIYIIGNIFVLALEGLLVFVQTLRLHFYEFFSKFYEGSGIQHKPIFVFNKKMDLSKYGS
ncbi:MAG: V-type ATP synthase subunit I [Candidatus Heimdallarchaeaceae archaeon]